MTMLQNVGAVSLQVLILFIMVGVGVICQKTKLLNDIAVKGISDLVVYIITPANIITAFQREFRSELLRGLGLAFLLAFLTFGLSTFIAKLLIRDKDEDRRVVLRFASAYPNAGYMGIPLQRVILGDIGVFYCAAYIAMFHMYIWTYGVHLLSKDKGAVRIKKLLASPCIISVVVGLALFVTGTTLPTIILSPLTSLASLATPVPMIIIGYYLGKSPILSILGNKYVYVCVFIKQILAPAIALGLCVLLNMRGDMIVSALIACSSSSAAMTTMLSAKYGRDAELSAGVVSLTTILAIVTMPLFIALAQTYFA